MPTPVLKYISIENGHPTYYWTPISYRKNLWGYIIFRVGDKIIDTVVGKDSSSYIDMNYNVDSGAYQGGVASRDSCGGIKGTSGYGFQHKTSFLTLNNDPCEGVLNLSWTKYVGWSTNDTVKEYQLLVKKNSAPEVIVATNQPSARNYIYTDFSYGDTLCIRVKCINLDNPSIFSYSNQKCLIAKNVTKPTKLQVINASYIENYITNVKWYCDPNSKAKNFIFEEIETKSGEVKRSFTPRVINYEGNGFYNFNDSFASSTNQVTYRVIFEDSCLKETIGVAGNTLFLNTIQVGLYNNELRWKTPLFPDSVKYTISGYDIYMSYESTPFVKIASISGSESLYKHSVEDLISTEGVFCYKIIAKYTFDTASHLKDKPFEIHSELSCLPMRSVVFIPNAFKINGFTPSFKPKFVFWKGGYFKMKIFNRWGALIFETDDAENGWNGSTNQGSMASEDSYTYIISYRGNDNKIVNRTGNVMLFK